MVNKRQKILYHTTGRHHTADYNYTAPAANCVRGLGIPLDTAFTPSVKYMDAVKIVPLTV